MKVKPEWHYSRPLNRSLEAYKAWITKMVAFLGGENDMTDAEWEAGWRAFWAGETDGQPA